MPDTRLMISSLSFGLLAHVFQALAFGENLTSPDLSFEIPEFGALALLDLAAELWGLFRGLASLYGQLAGFTTVPGMPNWIRLPLVIVVNVAILVPIVVLGAEVLGSAPGT